MTTPEGHGRPIQRVVTPLDGSKRARSALPIATALARQASAFLELLTVRADDAWEPALDELAATLDAPSVDTTRVAAGSPAQVIIELTGEPGTVTCLATRGRSGVSQTLLGSVAARIPVPHQHLRRRGRHRGPGGLPQRLRPRRGDAAHRPPVGPPAPHQAGAAAWHHHTRRPRRLAATGAFSTSPSRPDPSRPRRARSSPARPL